MAHNEDTAMLAAIGAMTAQVGNAKIRGRLEQALRGEEPARQKDELRQEVLSGDEAAKVLGVTRRTIQHLAKKGAIRRVTLPGSSKGCGYQRRSVEALVGA